MQAVVLVADKKFSLKVTGLGDVLAPNGGVIGEHNIQTHGRSNILAHLIVPSSIAYIELPVLFAAMVLPLPLNFDVEI